MGTSTKRAFLSQQCQEEAGHASLGQNTCTPLTKHRPGTCSRVCSNTRA